MTDADTTSDKARKTPRRVSRAETILLHKLMTEHLEQRGEGLYVYLHGQSDKTIGEAVASDIPVRSVIDIREELFGRLAPAGMPPTDGALAAKFDMLLLVMHRLADHINTRRTVRGDLPVDFFRPREIDEPVLYESVLA